jgi:6 kDa early secretory antigenic target
MGEGGWMDKLIVDFAVLEGAESEMRTVVHEIDDLRSMLHDKILPVTQQWTGAAAEAFGRAYELWQQAAADINLELAELHKLIVTAHRNHSSAVRTNVGIWRV